jgi:Bacteriophage minor capsid protein
MLTFSDVETYLQGYLLALDRYNPLPYFDPGPGATLDSQDMNPDRMVICWIAAGAGFDSEMVFDRPMVQIRTIGLQMNYSDAEQLAYDCDRGMTAIDHSQYINGKWVLAITRSGGGPTLLMKDDGDRYHFTCSYIWEVTYE